MEEGISQYDLESLFNVEEDNIMPAFRFVLKERKIIAARSLLADLKTSTYNSHQA